MNQAPELTLADHIPTPGACIGALWEVIPQIPSGVFEMVGALSEVLPAELDMEAGQ